MIREHLTTAVIFALVVLSIVFMLMLTAGATDRDPAQVRAFRKDHPCPATGKTTGPCPEFVVDHIIPLALYGADDPTNMQWQKADLAKRKDRLEFDAYRRMKEATKCR